LSSVIPNASVVTNGRPILPVVRIETFSPDEWETFVQEWLSVRTGHTYHSIEKFAGAGDKGVDVAAYISDPREMGYTWDCYQCKHYNNPLSPSQMWGEIGKFIYFCSTGHLKVPDKYYFVAPKGCGGDFSRLLQNPANLKQGLIDNWAGYCEKKITKGADITLDGALRTYVDNFDFSIFDKVTPATMVEEFKRHNNYYIWFGGGLPVREAMDENAIPSTVQALESTYVAQLLLAYGTASGATFSDVSTLGPPYESHFRRARINFHYAEQLRTLYRDSLPVGTFERFQDDIYQGIANICEDTHTNGFVKVKAVETQATVVDIPSNPLKDVSINKDKIGVCHQLCNENKIKWV